MFLLLISTLSSEDDTQFISAYLHQIIDVAVRASLAAERAAPTESETMIKETKQVSATLLNAIEVAVGSSEFIGAFSVVQNAIQQSKTEKKRIAAAEAITHPESYAARKVMYFF